MKLLIWGCGTITKNYFRYGYLNKEEIVGIIDSNKKNDIFEGYQIYLPHEIKKIEYDRILVCVLFHNDEIFTACGKTGIPLEKVYFLHNEISIGGVDNKDYGKKIKTIKEEYPAIYNDIRQRIKYVSRDMFYKKEPKIVNTSVIKYLGKSNLICWAPIELIFSERKEDMDDNDHMTLEWEDYAKEFQDIPLISMKPHRNLFDFLSEGNELPDLYCEWYRKIHTLRGIDYHYTDEQLIEMRLREYVMMMRELNRNGLNFFKENPAMARWNDRGYFNLLDGHHRSWFLYKRGFRLVPIQVTKNDFDLWANVQKVENVKKIIDGEKRVEFYQPILNPFFLNIQPYREDIVKSRMHHLLEYYGAGRLEEKKVLDIGANIGYFGLEFERLGAVVTLIEPDSSHYQLTKAVAELSNSKTEIVTRSFQEFETDQQYHIGIMLTVFYHNMKNENVMQKFLENLNKYVLNEVVWESGDDIEKEKELIINRTKFKKYKLLAYTYATGKIRELGVFYQ